MAILAANKFTLADWAKRVDPDGKTAKVVEQLSQTNEILLDAVFLEGNLPTGHRTTVRTGLPSAAWRKLNYGIQPSKSTTKQVDDTCGMLETYFEVDKDLADLNGNTKEFRISEGRANIEAMNQELASTIFYGDTDLNPERFLGFTPRYYDLSGETGSSIIDAGGSSDTCTSIWLVGWGENSVHMTFPKGTKAGIIHQDLGEVTLEDENGGRYQGYRDHWQWKAGLVVRDHRYVVRIANIDTANLPTDLPDMMVEALNILPNPGMCSTSFYMNRAVKTKLDILAMNKSNSFVQVDSDVFGRPQTAFQGSPIRRCDAIINTESAVS